MMQSHIISECDQKPVILPLDLLHEILCDDVLVDVLPHVRTYDDERKSNPYLYVASNPVTLIVMNILSSGRKFFIIHQLQEQVKKNVS